MDLESWQLRISYGIFLYLRYLCVRPSLHPSAFRTPHRVCLVIQRNMDTILLLVPLQETRGWRGKRGDMVRGLN